MMTTKHSCFSFGDNEGTIKNKPVILFICLFICLVQSSLTSIPVFFTDTDQNITVTNFSCITYDWEGFVECTWDYDVDDVKNVSIKWQLIYLMLSNNETLYNEAWNECPSPGVQLNSCKLELYMDIDAFKAFRLCIGGEFCSIVNIQALVKPNPVEILESTFNNSTAITLKWNHNRYFNKIFQLTIDANGLFLGKVFVQFEYINSTRQLCTTASKHSVICKRKVMKITLTHLSKYTSYSISVSSKPINSGFWSEKRTINIQTPKDVPSVSPTISPGSYSIQIKPEGIRVFTVYWQSVPKKTWNGEGITYRAYFMVKGKMIRKVINTTDCSATFQSVFDNDIINVVLWTQNEIGLSKEKSQITIHSKDHQYVDEIFAVKNKQYQIGVFWKHTDIDNVMSYEVFWCKQAFANLCKDTPSSTKIDSKQNNFTIDGNFDESASYLFGVSYTTHTNVTSGFIWSDCFIDLTTNGSTLNLETSLRPEQKGIRIKWWFTNCNFKSVKQLIKTYRVDICNQKDCKDFVNRLVSRKEDNVILDKAELKEVVCVKVTAEWNERKQKSSPVVCTDVDHNDGDVGPILLGVGAVFTILAIFGCFMIISKVMGLVEKARKPLAFELPVLNTNSLGQPENSGHRLLDT